MTSKTLIYKVARFNDETAGADLQSLLHRALRRKKAALSRRQEGDSENQYRLINYHGPYKGLRVGEFFDYTRGQKQPLAKMDEKADTLELSALAPPDKQSEFLHSILYFGVWKNSVMMSQSMSLKALHFEEYLNWLLRESGLLGDEDFISLCDHPPLDKSAAVQSAKKIEFHAPVELQPSADKRTRETSASQSVFLKPSGVAWNALKALLPPELKLPEKFTASEIVQNRSLEVRLLLKWSSVQRDDSTEFLDAISNQLRHVDKEVDYTIHTRSGTITREEFKLRRPASVPTNSEGLIEKPYMWELMYDWLQELIESTKIQPDT